MSSRVEYRQVGNSGLRVSVPILGAMSIGSPDWSPWVLGEDKAFELLKAAWDMGVNTWDTANIYSNGESERVIGKFISQFKIPRENLVILTKCRHLVASKMHESGEFMPELLQKRDYMNHYGLSRTGILNQVNASLERLQTSYIDLLQIHYYDEKIPIEETMRALHDLVAAGKVRYIGACNLKAWQMAEMNRVAEKNGWTQFISSQVEHSLLYRTEEAEMFPYCKYHGIGIIPYSPLLGGHLARPLGIQTERLKQSIGMPWERKHTKSDEQIIKRIEELAKTKGWTMAQIALAWSNSKTSSPIVGVNSAARLEEALVANRTLSQDELRYLEELYQVKPARF